jgi:HK97 family phage major capsid protein
MRKSAHVIPPDGMWFDADPDSVDQIIMEKAENGEAKRIHDFNDTCLLLKGVLGWSDERLQESKYWNRNMKKGAPMRKALDTSTSTDGSEWVPRGNMSGTFIEFYSLAAKVPMLFDPIRMPTPTYDVPYDNSLCTIFLISENTADEASATRVSDGSPTTGKLTLTAKTLGARIPFSYELEEDAVVSIAPRLRKKLANDMGKGTESAFIEGDTSGTHQHSDVTAATDRRKAFRGLRFHALAADSDSLSSFSAANIRTLRSKMGKYGVEPSECVLITGPAVYLRHIANHADVITRDKYGDNAYVLTGEVAKLDGMSVIVSDQMREDLNTSGVYDGTTTNNGSLIICNRAQWTMGVRSDMEMELWTNPLFRQRHLIAAWRGAFNTWQTADKHTVAGIDIDLA